MAPPPPLLTSSRRDMPSDLTTTANNNVPNTRIYENNNTAAAHRTNEYQEADYYNRRTTARTTTTTNSPIHNIGGGHNNTTHRSSYGTSTPPSIRSQSQQQHRIESPAAAAPLPYDTPIKSMTIPLSSAKSGSICGVLFRVILLGIILSVCLFVAATWHSYGIMWIIDNSTNTIPLLTCPQLNEMLQLSRKLYQGPACKLSLGYSLELSNYLKTESLDMPPGTPATQAIDMCVLSKSEEDPITCYLTSPCTSICRTENNNICPDPSDVNANTTPDGENEQCYVFLRGSQVYYQMACYKVQQESSCTYYFTVTPSNILAIRGLIIAVIFITLFWLFGEMVLRSVEKSLNKEEFEGKIRMSAELPPKKKYLKDQVILRWSEEAQVNYATSSSVISYGGNTYDSNSAYYYNNNVDLPYSGGQVVDNHYNHKYNNNGEGSNRSRYRGGGGVAGVGGGGGSSYYSTSKGTSSMGTPNTRSHNNTKSQLLSRDPRKRFESNAWKRRLHQWRTLGNDKRIKYVTKQRIRTALLSIFYILLITCSQWLVIYFSPQNAQPLTSIVSAIIGVVSIWKATSWLDWMIFIDVLLDIVLFIMATIVVRWPTQGVFARRLQEELRDKQEDNYSIDDDRDYYITDNDDDYYDNDNNEYDGTNKRVIGEGGILTERRLMELDKRNKRTKPYATTVLQYQHQEEEDKGYISDAVYAVTDDIGVDDNDEESLISDSMLTSSISDPSEDTATVDFVLSQAMTRDVCLLIACHNSTMTLERLENHYTMLRAALLLFPPSHIFVCDNSSSLEPADDNIWACEQVHPDINYLYVPEGNKTFAFYWCNKYWIPFLQRNERIPLFKYAVIIDDDVILPPDLHIPHQLLDQNPEIKAVHFPIGAAVKDGDKAGILIGCQDCEYRLAAVHKQLQATLARALSCHGAIALWDRETLDEVMYDHDTVFHGEDLQMGINLLKKRDNSRIISSAQTLIPTFAPDTWAKLFRQRVKSWDVTSHRKTFMYLFEIINPAGWCHLPSWILKPYFIQELLTICLDWLRVFLIFGLICRDYIAFLIMLGILTALVYIMVIALNYIILRQRKDIRIGFWVVLAFPWYRLNSLLFRIGALCQNVLVYSHSRVGIKISIREDEIRDIPPCPPHPDVDWFTVWNMDNIQQQHQQVTPTSSATSRQQPQQQQHRLSSSQGNSTTNRNINNTRIKSTPAAAVAAAPSPSYNNNNKKL